MSPRDHGGALDAAVARWGGTRGDWLDLSTGINPVPYSLPDLPAHAWTALPDATATARLARAARSFWRVPDEAAVLAAPGASALIARIPSLAPPARVAIPGPTYNEHEAAFRAAGWKVVHRAGSVHAGKDCARVVVHPNNPDGRLADPVTLDAPLTVIDESFCDTLPERSLIDRAARPGTLILKSFGKFWGLAGLRLGFAIGDPTLVARLAQMLGPWPVSGPALKIGAQGLEDPAWAAATRKQLAQGAHRLDRIATGAGVTLLGGTPLFRLYQVGDAARWAEALARRRILVRTFPYAAPWVRIGLPPQDGFERLQDAFRDLAP